MPTNAVGKCQHELLLFIGLLDFKKGDIYGECFFERISKMERECRYRRYRQIKFSRRRISLSDQNRAFLEARLLPGNADALTPYKRIIARAVCPAFEKDQDVSLSTGKKAISDYKKASGDVAGTLELMVWYIECGHKLTETYGDIDAPFYNSLISMYGNVLKQLRKNPEHTDMVYDRLAWLARESRNFGWGYSELYDLFTAAFPDGQGDAAA